MTQSDGRAPAGNSLASTGSPHTHTHLASPRPSRSSRGATQGCAGGLDPRKAHRKPRGLFASASPHASLATLLRAQRGRSLSHHTSRKAEDQSESLCFPLTVLTWRLPSTVRAPRAHPHAVLRPSVPASHVVGPRPCAKGGSQPSHLTPTSERLPKRPRERDSKAQEERPPFPSQNSVL